MKNVRQKRTAKSGLEIGCPKINKFKLSELNIANYNPRIIDDEAMAGLTSSLRRFGCVQPIVVNIREGRNSIVGGNQRFRSLLKQGVMECLCVSVDYSDAEEKILNLSLNNPKIQGQLKETLTAYIEELQKTLPEDLATLDLRIDQLLADIKNAQVQKGQIPKYIEEQIRPYKKTHILLSFEPGILINIHEQLEALVKEPGVEYEQCSN